MNVTWQSAAVLVTFGLGLAGLLLLAIRWLLNREFQRIDQRFIILENARAGEYERRHEIEKNILAILAKMPEKFVMRDDWIRFASLIDSKLDAVHRRIDEW